MIIEFDCEICKIHMRVRRAKGRPSPHYCSPICKAEAQRRQPLPVTREWLNQKYTVEGLGCPEIGKLADRDGSTVRLWLVEYGIPTRPRGYNHKKNLLNGRPKGWNHTPETIEKVRQATIRDGRVPYLRNGQHFNKGKRGAVVHNWKGGITPERQAFYRSDEWKRASKAVWVRDDAKCRRCGLDSRTVDRKKAKFHVHHIVTFANKELRADPDNLVLLCPVCHYYVHSSENVDREFLSDGPPANGHVEMELAL